MAAIYALKPDGTKQKFLLEKEQVVIGRGQDADIVVADEVVSRHHCAITTKGTRYYLRDLNSRNGTFLNGQKTTQAELGYDDRIKIGNVTLLFHPDMGKGTATMFREVSDMSAKGKGYHTIMKELVKEAGAKAKK